MSSIVKKIPCSLIGDCEIGCVMVDDEPWFNSIDVCHACGFKSKQSRGQALTTHVHDDDRQSLEFLLSVSQSMRNIDLVGNDGVIIYINESGLYSLAFGSKKPFARLFKRWVTSEVLPTIRKTGSYALPPPAQPTLIAKQIKLLNETDLHNKVVDLLRNTFPELKPVPGLGELQDTPIKRSDAYKKGYVGGQPDVMILNQTSKYNSFAIELKTPKGNGKVSDNQNTYLESLKDLRYKTFISNDYDEIVVELTRYYDDLRFPCPHCSKTFKSTRTRSGHIRACH